MDEEKLGKDKKRFTKFLTKFAKQEESKSDGLYGGITVHILAPQQYLDRHLCDFVKPKKFEVTHWNLIEKWWMIPDDEMVKIRTHYSEMSTLTRGTLEVFEKISIRRCNRVPSKFPIRSKNELIWVLLANLKDYQYCRYPKVNVQTIQKGSILENHFKVEKIKKICAPVFWSVIIDNNPPTRLAPSRPKTKYRKIKRVGWPQLPRTKCRLSLVKVLGEYWGWDFFYTQFRIRKEFTPMSKSEVVIKEFDLVTRSMIRHLIWCFREHKLWFESINNVIDTLKTLI
jgi:hypothetical protein